MLLVDSLVVIGLATVSLDTIHETDGVQEHNFWLRNAGADTIVLRQGYTSCGCTTITFEQGRKLAPGDSTRAALHFNPQGKGGDFLEQGTIVYGDRRQRVEMALEGTCITSDETLMRQFPIQISDEVRLSTDHFDLGIMHPGERKERSVVVLHRMPSGNRQELLPIVYQVDAKTPKGLQHIDYPIQIHSSIGQYTHTIKLDVLIK